MKVIIEYSRQKGASIAHFTDPYDGDDTTTMCGLNVEDLSVTSAMQRDFPVCQVCEDQFVLTVQR